MLDAKIIDGQLKRLLSLDFPPREPEGVKDLSMALQSAYTEAIAVVIVNEWVGSQNECPRPAQLRKAIWEENEKLELRRHPTIQGIKCGRCYDTGRVRDWGTTNEWIFCQCPGGDRAKRENPALCQELNEEGARLWAKEEARRRKKPTTLDQYFKSDRDVKGEALRQINKAELIALIEREEI